MKIKYLYNSSTSRSVQGTERRIVCVRSTAPYTVLKRTYCTVATIFVRYEISSLHGLSSILVSRERENGYTKTDGKRRERERELFSTCTSLSIFNFYFLYGGALVVSLVTVETAGDNLYHRKVNKVKPSRNSPKW